jgi:hypothetical protein
MLRKAKVCALDRLLLGSEAGLDPAAEMSERSQLSARTESPFASVLTGRSGEGESFAETEDNGRIETGVCGKTKGGRIMDVAARTGRGVNRDVWRHRHPRRRCPKRAAGRGRRGALLRDRGEGTR